VPGIGAFEKKCFVYQQHRILCVTAEEFVYDEGIFTSYYQAVEKTILLYNFKQ
jgi:hypothetical protein